MQKRQSLMSPIESSPATKQRVTLYTFGNPLQYVLRRQYSLGECSRCAVDGRDNKGAARLCRDKQGDVMSVRPSSKRL